MKLKVSIDHNLCLECQNNKGGKKWNVLYVKKNLWVLGIMQDR
jgi:hypothetical protein